MPKTDQDTKQKRVELVYRLLERHLNGLTEQEIADMLNMERRTVNNYLRELEIQGKLYKEGRLWLVLPYQRTRLCRFELSPEEAMTLYLATRLLVKQHDKRNESAETALVKLAEVLTGDVGVGHEIHQAALELAQRPGDESYSRVFRTIMQSYIYRRKVSITYYPMNSDPFQTVLSPYLLEPSAIGYATYVIGHSSIVNALRTYKLERIQQATLTREEYTVPPDFPGLDYLRSAWSIISGDELIEVKLRFSRRVTRRVRETLWHPSQKDIKDDPDNPGGCIWEAQIADLTDFTPWVRSWGADVEVLEPETLREKLVKETQRMALLYNVGDVTPPPLYQRLWAKTSDDKTQTHPLICHMIDVAQVALAVWNEVLTDSVRAQFAETLGLDEDAAGRLIAFWAGLHDMGKASPAFQRQYLPMRYTLERAGLLFEMQVGDSSCYHGTITARTLEPLLAQETALGNDWAYNVAVAVGGHHGDWPTPQNQDMYASIDERGGEPWDQVRRDLFLEMKEILEPPDLASPHLPVEMTNSFFTLLSGLVSVADWLGSMEDYFEFASEYMDLEKYVQHAERQAKQVLKEQGWSGWRSPTSAISFEELCDVPSPRPLQETVIELVPQLDQPALVIIEAPTGVGKTETALYLADHWARVLQQRGTYVAMPTMATSNQMFKRVREMLTRRYPDELVNYHLLHGSALLMKDEQLPRLAKIEGEGGQGTVAALTWFTKRKRGLLATFAVGTVDQALMSILQMRHFFVRLFGLSHKTVIFDEIHAYDTYMEELFYLLLRWLRVIGTSVVILSATLPEVTRHRLVKEYTGLQKVVFPEKVRYPMLTWTMGDQPKVLLLETPEEQQADVNLERISRQPEDIARRLAQELRGGGCAAVICNTVRRAQQIYEAIRDAKFVPKDDLTLFHARFPHTWRMETENKVLDQFGKQKENEDKRPPKAIVVATQVIEQSLDLDFDLMVSDLAPVDLIIQRIGRLHRHKRKKRPALVSKPRLLLALPDLQDGLPVFDRGDVYIYGRYLLLRSYLALRKRDCISTLNDVQLLVESVYGPESTIVTVSELFQEALDRAGEAMEQRHRKARREASSKLIPEPHKRGLLELENASLEEDDPEMHKYKRAATRLAPPSIILICLHRMPHGLALDPEPGSPTVDIKQEPDRETTRALFARKIRVSDYHLVEYFADQPVPSSWKRNAWLHYARPVEFEGGVYDPITEPWLLKLDRELGLIVQDKEE